MNILSFQAETAGDDSPPTVSAAVDDALGAWIERAGMIPHAEALRALADTLEDLVAMEDGDVDEFVRSERVPQLKARRFRRALRDLGADVSV